MFALGFLILAPQFPRTFDVGFLEPSAFVNVEQAPVSVGRLAEASVAVVRADYRSNFEAATSVTLSRPGSALIVASRKPELLFGSAVRDALSPFGFDDHPSTVTVTATAAAAIDGEDGKEVWTRRVGRSPELRFVLPPSGSGGDVSLRFYGDSGSIEMDCPVRACNTTTGESALYRTSRVGSVNLIDPTAGVWRIAAAQFVQSSTGAKLYVATMTFEVRK